MKYRDWLETVPFEITGDPLWKIEAYRLALFIADIAWQDVTKLPKDKRTIGVSDQLYRAAGSIGENISEGLSRSSGRDRARFYEYALGSSRECRTWYFNARHILKEEVTSHRIQLLTQITKLLLVMVPNVRSEELHEDAPNYTIQNTDLIALDILLTEVPAP